MLQSFNYELEKMDGYETDFVKILYYDLPQNYVDTYESQSYIRICSILEGQKNISVEDREFSYNHQQSLLLPAHSKVLMHIEKPTKALVFELNDKLIQTVLSKMEKHALCKDNAVSLNKDTFSHLLIYKQRQLQKDLNQLMEICKADHKKEPFLIDLYAQKLVYELLKDPSACQLIQSQTITPMDKAVEIMKRHLYTPLTITELAEHLSMSKSNFSHTFKKHMDTTPQQYYMALKLKHAQHLLQHKNVTETAYNLGFNSPSYFIRAFKKHYGITPKQFVLNTQIKR